MATINRVCAQVRAIFWKIRLGKHKFWNLQGCVQYLGFLKGCAQYCALARNVLITSDFGYTCAKYMALNVSTSAKTALKSPFLGLSEHCALAHNIWNIARTLANFQNIARPSENFRICARLRSEIQISVWCCAFMGSTSSFCNLNVWKTASLHQEAH